MDDRKLYLIACLDEGSQTRLANLYSTLQARGVVGTQTKGIPYHITMSEVDIKQRPQLEALLRTVAAHTPPFEIGFGYVGLFGQQVMFAAPTPNLELLQLKQRLDPGSVNGAHRWTPHVTLLIDQPSEVLSLIPIATQHFQPFIARVESLLLLEYPLAKALGCYALNGVD